MDTATAQELLEPIIVYRSVNGDGQTFALDPDSRRRLRNQFGDAVHLYPRVFIAHESREDYQPQRVDGNLATHVIVLLTGVAESRLMELGGVSFRNPVTEEELTRH